MILYLLRHASAGDSVADPVKDAKRGLDDDGIVQCRQIGRALAALDVQPEVMIASPLKRALQTASVVANELSYESKIVTDKAMLPSAGFSDFSRMLNEYVHHEAIIAVGHGPSIDVFLSRCIGMPASSSPAVALKKGAVARVDLSRSLKGTLVWLLTPKLVRSIQASLSSSSRPKTSRK